MQDLHDNLEACKCNLDMILRWLSLRFFDTNPSVIMRAMDYLKHVFSALNEDEYHVMDFEAYAFLPFLVQKVSLSAFLRAKGIVFFSFNAQCSLSNALLMLNEDEYHVKDLEAYAFLPFLVKKVKICM